ncbi:MAG: aminotransferase class I/II-fold pyridoxal phosphate-dependent enzyme [Lachnospiraceae bacterium]
MEQEHLLEQLKCYASSDAYPFHMPGHKRQWADLVSDITEIDGFDDLHHARGILKECMERAADLYHADQTFYLVNGSTCGILAAIFATVKKGGKMLMMRGSHKSAYHAVALREIVPVYLESGILPGLGLDLGICPAQIIKACEQEAGIEAVFLTCPTYEGVSVNLREIAEYLHQKEIPLIVDAAHGAHFGMADYLPENAIAQGADLVIHSIHKTLPAPTQTALLHCCGSRISPMRVEHFLDYFETSSPSYLLMGAMDRCISYLKKEGKAPWERFYQMRRQLSDSLRNLKSIGILDAFATDNPWKLPASRLPELGKMVIYLKKNNHGGKWLYDRLRLDYHLQPELSLPGYVLLFFTIADRKEGYDRLRDALHDMDEKLQKDSLMSGFQNEGDKISSFNALEGCEAPSQFVHQEKVNKVPCLTIGEAEEAEKRWTRLEEAEGRICGDYIQVYPPGQPFLVPGEVITRECIRQMKDMLADGYEIRGIEDNRICVLKGRN